MEVKPLKILLADDTPVNLTLVTKLLTKRGHEVVPVENGLLAFETFKKGSFDAILMDVQMPVMDGMEATQKIRQYEKELQESGNSSGSGIPIIALTANNEPGDRETYLRKGMDDVITKPMEIKTVIPTIQAIIAKKKANA